jgi:hypothetical protein
MWDSVLGHLCGDLASCTHTPAPSQAPPLLFQTIQAVLRQNRLCSFLLFQHSSTTGPVKVSHWTREAMPPLVLYVQSPPPGHTHTHPITGVQSAGHLSAAVRVSSIPYAPPAVHCCNHQPPLQMRIASRVVSGRQPPSPPPSPAHTVSAKSVWKPRLWLCALMTQQLQHPTPRQGSTGRQIVASSTLMIQMRPPLLTHPLLLKPPASLPR